jgi:TPR repeat protein
LIYSRWFLERCWSDEALAQPLKQKSELNVRYIKLFFYGFFTLASTNAVSAEQLTCIEGGSDAVKNYQRAMNLLTGVAQGENEFRETLMLLQNAVKQKCSGAALDLAFIKLNHLPLKADITQEAYKKLDDEIYELLVEATKLNEGWFELGNYLLAPFSRHQNPKLAEIILEKAAMDGDHRAMMRLADCYQDGSHGCSINEARFHYWMDKMKNTNGDEKKPSAAHIY